MLLFPEYFLLFLQDVLLLALLGSLPVALCRRLRALHDVDARHLHDVDLSRIRIDVHLVDEAARTRCTMVLFSVLSGGFHTSFVRVVRVRKGFDSSVTGAVVEHEA